jgi:GntR family transcriptional regulator
MKPAHSSRKTLTDAVQEELRQAILNGSYQPGSQLPTEAELGQMLGASRTVVREALRILEEDGLIFRRHGVGTFVRKHPILKNLNINYGITDMIQLAGLEPGTAHLAVYPGRADEEIAAQLDVPIGTPMLNIERVRTAAGKPVVYSLDTFAQNLLGGRQLDSNRFFSESVYKILQDDWGLTIDYGIARILPAKAPVHIAEKLALPPDAMVLYLVQTDYSPLDEPILYSREYHLPDEFDFVIWRRGPNKLGTLKPLAISEE